MNENEHKSGSIICDLLVIGSGAGGMAAAVAAHILGLKVIVAEKEEVLGGATARSGGCAWIPAYTQSRREMTPEGREAALTYFKHETAKHYNPARVEAFVDLGPEMVEFFEKHSQYLRFHVLPYPDYHPESPGAVDSGRTLWMKPFDGRLLGSEIKKIRRPLPYATVFGMMVGMDDMYPMMTVGYKVSSFAYTLRLLLILIRDKLFCGRTMRLVNGASLIARFMKTALDRGIPLWTSAQATSLLIDGDRVNGAVIATKSGDIRVEARRGVVLATGGFPHDHTLRSRLYPAGARDSVVWSMMPYGNTGDGLRMGMNAGGYLNDNLPCKIAMSPLSALHMQEGQLASFPFILTRSQPGFIAVTREGKRFVNEACNYHDFCRALLAATYEKSGEEASAYIICDHRALRHYGLGYVKPFPVPFINNLRSGYLKKGNTLETLAEVSGIDPDVLRNTVIKFNKNAAGGKDPEFNRGESIYDRFNGDPEHQPNPCLGPLIDPPFYSITVVAGVVGTFTGLVTDEHARVLDDTGAHIAGLYAAGNDLGSITGGVYIGGGCTIGPALTFGYIAAKHASSS